jgi:hypothetical protein
MGTPGPSNDPTSPSPDLHSSQRTVPGGQGSGTLVVLPSTRDLRQAAAALRKITELTRAPDDSPADSALRDRLDLRRRRPGCAGRSKDH